MKATEHTVDQHTPASRITLLRMALLLALLVAVNAGCSVKKFAVNKIGDALAESGTTFASDDDPELVRDAVPFSLKLIESLLAEAPQHQGLLLAAASGFTQYSYAFVHEKADRVEVDSLAAADVLRARARGLYLRARDYGLRGLEARHKNFRQDLRANPRKAVRTMSKKDVSYLYWTAASWALAISVSKNDPQLIADQPAVEALIDRAFELDPGYEHGALHGFLITYEGARQGAEGDPVERSRRHFQEAVNLTGGHMVAPFVSLAESVAVQEQNRAEFESLLKQALDVNVDARPEWRLVNILMQRRARWLLSRTDELFLPADATPNKEER